MVYRYATHKLQQQFEDQAQPVRNKNLQENNAAVDLTWPPSLCMIRVLLNPNFKSHIQFLKHQIYLFAQSQKAKYNT